MKTLKNAPKLILLTLMPLLTISCAQQGSSGNELVAKKNQQVKAYAKFVPIREDDFAWENDLVAFLSLIHI